MHQTSPNPESPRKQWRNPFDSLRKLLLPFPSPSLNFHHLRERNLSSCLRVLPLRVLPLRRPRARTRRNADRLNIDARTWAHLDEPRRRKNREEERGGRKKMEGRERWKEEREKRDQTLAIVWFPRFLARLFTILEGRGGGTHHQVW